MTSCNPTSSTVTVEVRWEDWWEAQLKWPIVVQFGLTVAFLLVVQPLLAWAKGSRSSRLRELIKTYVGTSERPEVSRPQALIVIYCLQIVGSIASVGIWVYHTYRRSPVATTQNAELAICVIDIVTWMVNRLRSQCTAMSLWELNGLVDVLTVVPTLQRSLAMEGLEAMNDSDWLSLQFLRSYQALFCFARIQETGYISYSAVLVQMLIQVLFQVYCLLTVMAGTIFTCEVLGDPPVFADSFIETQFGDRISFLQMVYWVMISVTTVGYGDFAPRTVASRILTAIFIVIGVAAIFFLEFRVSEFVKRRWEGSGSYRPRSKHEKHVVIVLCLKGAASKLSSMVAGFLQEILHASHDPWGGEEAHWLWCLCPCRQRKGMVSWPNVVIFSPTNWDDVGSSVDGEDAGSSFADFLRTRELPPAARRRVWFLVGKVSSKADLDRAGVGSSTLTYLVSDVNSESPDEADGQNIFASVILRNHYPHLRMRVMLLRPESKELAVQAGVAVNRCFSARELKANMLAQNVRCHGLVPMITGMLCSAGQEDEEYFLRSVDGQARSWNEFWKKGTDETPKPDSKLTPTKLSFFSRGTTLSSSMMDDRSSESPSLQPSQGKGSLEGADMDKKLSKKVRLRRSQSMVSQHTSESAKRTFRKSSHVSGLSESLEAMKYRMRNSETYYRKDTDQYEVCDPWMFAYFGGLRRSVHGFELSAQYAGLSFGELVHAVFRDTEALVIGIYENGRLLICPQHTHLRFIQTCQLCFAVAESPEQLDPVRFKGSPPDRWRDRIMAMMHNTAKVAVSSGAHLEASKLCAHTLRATLVPRVSSRAQKRTSMMDADIMLRRRESALPVAMPDELHRQISLEEDMGKDDNSRPNMLSPTRGSVVLNEEDPSMRIEPELPKELPSPTGPSPPEVHPVQRVRELRRTLGDFEELVVLVVGNGEVWQQVRTFVACLRAPQLPVQQPIVVLVPAHTTPPPNFLEDWDNRVVVVKGNRFSAQVLLTAGILEASAVVVMTGEVPSKGHFQEPVFKDYQVMLLAQELECWCGISEREIFATFELQDSRSVRHLPPLVSKEALQLQELLDDSFCMQSRTSRAADFPSEESFHLEGAGADPIFEEEEFSETKKTATSNGFDESVLFHPRFAAGQVFTPEIWGAMLGRTFYNPAVIETVEALVIPHRRGQSAFPWQIRVPPAYVGEPYSVLVKDMALGGWEKGPSNLAQDELDDTMPRRFSDAGRKDPPPKNSSTNPISYIRQPPEGPAVPVALYRSRDDILNQTLDFDCFAQGTGGHNYNILAPPGHTVLRGEDWVLVIGSHRFGRKVYNMGLLRASGGPPGQKRGSTFDAGGNPRSSVFDAGGNPRTNPLSRSGSRESNETKRVNMQASTLDDFSDMLPHDLGAFKANGRKPFQPDTVRPPVNEGDFDTINEEAARPMSACRRCSC